MWGGGGVKSKNEPQATPQPCLLVPTLWFSGQLLEPSGLPAPREEIFDFSFKDAGNGAAILGHWE